MEIEIDEGSGFCFGVTTAISKAEEELAREGSLYCLGDIVHNGRECERLRRMGLVTIGHEEFARLEGGKVLLRAHGEPPETYAAARERGIRLIDATCPVVLGLQRRIAKVYAETPRPQIVIYGKRGHAEVLGLVGQTRGEAIVIENLDEVDRIDLTRSTCLFSQTTKPLEGFREVAAYLTRSIVPPATFRSFDTICRRVAGRLPGVEAFAARHDAVIFVCGLKSSNGRVLFEACRKRNAHTYMVDNPEAIRPEWIAGVRTVGICGATSTPTWLMEDCRERVARLAEGLDAKSQSPNSEKI